MPPSPVCHMRTAVRFLLRPRLLLSCAAGLLIALGLWLFWPVGPRAVLPAVDRLRAVFFAPDGKFVVTLHWRSKSEGDDESSVIVWDTATGQERRQLYAGSPEIR